MSVGAPTRSERGNPVDKKTSERLHVPGQRAKAKKNGHLRFGHTKLILEQTAYRQVQEIRLRE
jgi:hypothetical protein